MFDRKALVVLLEKHEGRERKPYVDTVGKTTIGVGWNLSDKGLPDEIIDRLLHIAINEVEAMLDARIPWWRKLDDVRQLVLMDMGFNMGGKLFTFVNTLAAVKRGEWTQAAAGMRASKWAKQVGQRAERLARMMETGDAGGAGV